MAIQIINRQKKFTIDTRRLRRSALRILKALGCSNQELNILLTDDPGIQEINRQYLGRDKTTNVISFAMAEGDACGISDAPILGDIVISVETALRDGIRGSLSLDHEIDFLLIHGMLHLLGFDHIGSRKKAREMKAKEHELFEILNGFEIS